MPERDLSDLQCERLSAFIAQTMALHFPSTRWSDMLTGIAASARRLGHGNDVSACTAWLLSRPRLTQEQIGILASHLTVGESYFLRDAGHLEILTEHIVPELARRHKQTETGTRHLRIWCAGCCRGEEPYSIAIWLLRNMPALRGWKVTIVGSDINPQSLDHARDGIYGSWSLRQAPVWLADYFRIAGKDRFEILPHVQRMVRFVPFNLAEEADSVWSREIGEVDVIFCRNVLMYFTPEQARRTLEKMHALQANGGWLIVGTSEWLTPQTSPYTARHLKGLTVYCKSEKLPAAARCEGAPAEFDVIEGDFEPPSYAARRYAALSPAAPASRFEPALPTAQELADRGQFAEALASCEDALRHDRFNPTHYFVRALILKEQGALGSAARSLNQALYLNPAFLAAHVTLGYVQFDRGKPGIARRHFRHAIALLHRMDGETKIPDLADITARQCLAMIGSRVETEVNV